MEDNRQRIHVADWVKLVFVLVVIFIVYRLAATFPNTIILFLVGAIIAYILHPFVNWLVKNGFPRWAAVTVVYVVAFLLIILIIFLITPPFVSQAQEFAKNAPQILKKANSDYMTLINRLPAPIRRLLPANFNDLVNAIASYAQTQTGKLTSLVAPVISGITGTILVVVFSIFILLFLDEIDGWFKLWLPGEYLWLYNQLAADLDTGYSGYIIGQIIVSVVHGLTVGIVAAIFGLPFAIVQGIYAAIVQIIPIIGPILAVLPAILLAFIASFQTGIIVTIILALAMAVEGTFLTPYILGAAAVISPIVIFAAIVAGGEVGGAGGAILAVPVIVFLNIIWQFTRKNVIYRPAPPSEKPPTTIEVQPRPPETPPEQRPEPGEVGEEPKPGEEPEPGQEE